MKKITLLISLIILISCRKSNVSPLFWGKEKEAMYYYDLCKDWGFLLYNNGELDILVDKLPDEFKDRKNDTGIKVKVNTREVRNEGSGFTNLPCSVLPPVKNSKYVHVLCIRKP